MIPPTLPGSEYGLYIDPARADGARLFTGRKGLTSHCLSLCPPRPVLAEIGVFGGDFSRFLYDTAAPSRMVLIDTFCTSDHVRGQFTHNTHLAYIQGRFRGDPGVECRPGLSWDVLATLPDASLDYAYLDADHSYDAVTRDIAALRPKMRPGGIIQFNDYTHYGSYERSEYGVLWAVNEFIEASPEVTLVGLSIDRSGYHDLAVRVGTAPAAPVVAPVAAPNTTRLTLVTPCSRPENLEALRASIDFEAIDAWYIIYDTRWMPFAPRYAGHPKIVELGCSDEGMVGHPIRNHALGLLHEGYIYFLDDDNIIHPGFWEVRRTFVPSRIYTFDMVYADGRILTGDRPVPEKIDTAQFVFDASLVGTLRFHPGAYNADGHFIQALVAQNPGKHTYVPQVAAHYNHLRPT